MKPSRRKHLTRIARVLSAIGLKSLAAKLRDHVEASIPRRGPRKAKSINTGDTP